MYSSYNKIDIGGDLIIFTIMILYCCIYLQNATPIGYGSYDQILSPPSFGCARSQPVIVPPLPYPREGVRG